MTYYPVQSPYPIFNDENGTPLEDGYIYIGEAYQNPITNPITANWDTSGLYPAAQPIRTIAGYPDRNGSPGIIYVNAGAFEDYSILVEDKDGNQIYYEQSAVSAAGGLGSNALDVINDLRAITGFDQPLYIRGHTAIADGGQGTFEWTDGVAPGTYVDDDGITIVPTGGDGSGAWIRQYDGTINVKWYHAVGDGTTDDNAAIQAAIDVADSLYFPLATYAIDDPIYIDAQINIDFGGSTIKSIDAGGTKRIMEIGTNAHCENVTLSNLILDGDRSSRAAPPDGQRHSIIVWNCENFYFENITSNNSIGDGAYFGSSDNTLATQAQNGTILKLTIDNAYRNGLSVTEAQDITFIDTISNNTNGTSPQAGIDLEGNGNSDAGTLLRPRNINFRGTTIVEGNSGSGFLWSADAINCSIEKIISKDNDVYGFTTQNGYGGEYPYNCYCEELLLDGNLQGGSTTVGQLHLAGNSATGGNRNLIFNRVVVINTPFDAASKYGILFPSTGSCYGTQINNLDVYGGGFGVEVRGANNKILSGNIANIEHASGMHLANYATNTIISNIKIDGVTSTALGFRDAATNASYSNISVKNCATHAGLGTNILTNRESVFQQVVDDDNYPYIDFGDIIGSQTGTTNSSGYFTIDLTDFQFDAGSPYISSMASVTYTHDTSLYLAMVRSLGTPNITVWLIDLATGTALATTAYTISYRIKARQTS